MIFVWIWVYYCFVCITVVHCFCSVYCLKVILFFFDKLENGCFSGVRMGIHRQYHIYIYINIYIVVVVVVVVVEVKNEGTNQCLD